MMTHYLQLYNGIKTSQSFKIKNFGIPEIHNLPKERSNDIKKLKNNDVIISDTGKFADEIFKKCLATPDVSKDSASLLTESFIELANKIDSLWGREKANNFMTNIVKNTENNFSENRIVALISGFFGDLARQSENSDAIANGLIDIKLSLNQGLDILIDKDVMLTERLDRGETPGLAFSLSNFFSSAYSVAEDKESVETLGFNDKFEREPMKIYKEPEWLEDGPVGPGYYCFVNTGQSVDAKELYGSELLSELSNYLRTIIGNNNAADLLDNSSADSNIMDTLAMTIAIVANENENEVAKDYVSYLNSNIKSAINSTLDKGFRFEGWRLALAKSPTSTAGLIISSNEIDDIIQKGHDALDTHWNNKNGVQVFTKGKDLTDLYLIYSSR